MAKGERGKSHPKTGSTQKEPPVVKETTLASMGISKKESARRMPHNRPLSLDVPTQGHRQWSAGKGTRRSATGILWTLYPNVV